MTIPIARAATLVAFLLLAIAAIGLPDATLPRGLEIENTSIYRGGGKYDWTLYLLGSRDALKHVSRVDYVLDYAFQRIGGQVQRSTQRVGHFAVTSYGRTDWAVRQAFTITAAVLVDGATYQVKYSLHFNDPIPGSDEEKILDAINAYARLENERDERAWQKLRDVVILSESALKALRARFAAYKQYQQEIECGRLLLVGVPSPVAHCIARENMVGLLGERAVPTDAKPILIRLLKQGDKWKLAGVPEEE
jgi:hypothetical protein